MENLEEFQFSEELRTCVIPSLDAVFTQLQELLLANLLFCITGHLSEFPLWGCHLASIIFGCFALNSLIPTYCVYWYCGFVTTGYLALRALKKLQKNVLDTAFSVATLVFLVVCGEVFIDQEDWISCRGTFMIATMKLLSLSRDLHSILENFNITSYFGYMFCPANIIFGPWISFKEYSACNFVVPNKLRWLKQVCLTALAALVFLTISNCWASYLIPDDSYTWFVTYRQAFTFRTSHYFVSYLSESLMSLAGYKMKATDEWGYEIVKPFDIEMPASLVHVVISWNIPMHKFLKKYIYRSALAYGQSLAIVITYIISSLLHGYSLEISAVLLSIGLFSIAQLRFLTKLAQRLDACVGVRPCKAECDHKVKRNHIMVRLVTCASAVITVVNLAYLGCVMDGAEGLQRWSDLNFICHVYMFVIYIISYLL